ncbi:hypothetical protein [Ideonella sp. YS5]|uniref:hypothetical protein n=1 Tax=Ideonella sp. YS5 TaxID=3453714 RepID=UPI003EED916B
MRQRQCSPRVDRGTGVGRSSSSQLDALLADRVGAPLRLGCGVLTLPKHADGVVDAVLRTLARRLQRIGEPA